MLVKFNEESFEGSLSVLREWRFFRGKMIFESGSFLWLGYWIWVLAPYAKGDHNGGVLENLTSKQARG